VLEQAKETTRYGKFTYIEYARFADDLVILIDAHPRHDWLMGAVEKRLREELAKLQVETNEEKSRTVDLSRGESFKSRIVITLNGSGFPALGVLVLHRRACCPTLTVRSFSAYRRVGMGQELVRGPTPDALGRLTGRSVGATGQLTQRPSDCYLPVRFLIRNVNDTSVDHFVAQNHVAINLGCLVDGHVGGDAGDVGR
jgi:hypothetical protein